MTVSVCCGWHLASYCAIDVCTAIVFLFRCRDWYFYIGLHSFFMPFPASAAVRGYSEGERRESARTHTLVSL